LPSLSLLLPQIERMVPSLIVAVDVQRRTRSCCNFKVWATRGATSSRRHEKLSWDTCTITLRKFFNLIFLYNYIAHFDERTPWCINQFVYASIANFWSSFLYGWLLHKTSQIVIPTYQSTHVHVTLP
jgi:hypothetical protein